MLTFKYKVERFRDQLLESKPVDAGSWHSIPTAGNPMLVTMELPFVDFVVKVPDRVDRLQEYCRPNLPWAEDHFAERVSGMPLNPAPSHNWWPWSHKQHHDENEEFSHTYPERFWPRFANAPVMGSRQSKKRPNGREVAVPHNGIRYEYGDLGDVVKLLCDNAYTRQAVLPVFFPEDTGNVSGVRIPCSLYYHFMYRDDALHCHYTMRSCDFVRHFKDDVYMAARLLQWVADQTDLGVGTLKVSISSLHAMEGDRYKMTEEKKNGTW